MATLTMADYASALKTFYLPVLNNQVERARPFINRLVKNNEDVSGNFAYVALVTNLNRAVGARGEVSDAPKIPTGDKQSYGNATYPMRYNYASLKVGGPAMRASKDSRGGYAKVMDQEMQGLMETLPRDLNRQLCNTARGDLATNSAAFTTATNKVTVDTIEHLYINDEIEIRFAEAGTICTSTSTKITAIDEATKVVTFNQNFIAQDTTASHAILVHGESPASGYDGSSYGVESHGLLDLVSTSNPVTSKGAAVLYGGIDRTTAANSYWKGNNIDNGGTNRAITNGLVKQGLLKAEKKQASMEKLEGWCHPDVWATVGLLPLGDRRYNDYKETTEMGWEFIKYDGKKIFYDWDMKNNRLWWLDMGMIMLLSQGGYDFIDDGSIISRVSGRDAYEATLNKDMQLGAKNCNKHVVISDLSTSITV